MRKVERQRLLAGKPNINMHLVGQKRNKTDSYGREEKVAFEQRDIPEARATRIKRIELSLIRYPMVGVKGGVDMPGDDRNGAQSGPIRVPRAYGSVSRTYENPDLRGGPPSATCGRSDPNDRHASSECMNSASAPRA